MKEEVKNFVIDLLENILKQETVPELRGPIHPVPFRKNHLGYTKTYWRLVFCQEGNVNVKHFTEDGPVQEKLSAGQIFLAPPRCPFDIVDSSGLNIRINLLDTLINIIVYENGKETLSHNFTATPNWPLRAKLSLTMNELYQARLNTDAPLATLREKVFFETAMLQLYDVMTVPNPETENDDWKTLSKFNELTAIITSNQAVLLKRPDVAAQIGITEQYLNLITKRYRGLSFQNYYMLCRLEYARLLLANKKLKMNDVATMCGFRDSNYFIQAFRKQYNITPLKFRKLQQQGGGYSRDQAAILHHTEKFVVLPNYKTIESVPKLNEEIKHCALLVCNGSSEIIEFFFVTENGIEMSYAILQPGERRHFGFNTGMVMKVTGEDHRLLGYYQAPGKPALIIIHDKMS